jgi:phosphatidylethanolamine/phosphatidyl-N-methylethanolamine N-methyltransferase
VRDHLEFFRQFRQRFDTTGSVMPSSRFLARAMTGPFQSRRRPARILEVGPGTGAVTQRIVRLMQPGDRLDLVEINETFADLLQRRFRSDAAYRRVAPQSRIHVGPLQEFEGDGPYDYIVSGLPLNNFSIELVHDIFDSYLRLLAPDGVLSYFEYMAVRPIRKVVGSKTGRRHIRELDEVLTDYLDKYRFRRSWVFCNFPPAWVQHLRHSEEPASVP